MIGLVNIRDRLQTEKRQEALKEQTADATAAAVAATAEAMLGTDSEPASANRETRQFGKFHPQFGSKRKIG
jgi:hypothetical protein